MLARRTIMKRILTITCMVLLVALLCVTCVACSQKGDTPGTDDGNHNNQYEVAKYTVTFNTASNYTFDNNVLKGVVAGSKIKAPTNENGDKIIPVKTGYTFQYWTEDGKKEFDFNTQTINKNTTLTAFYTPNEFKHNYVLGATYTYNDDGTITVNEGEYQNLTGKEMTISADAKLQSVYNDNANLDCPAAEDDDFCFWFYIDKDNKPVQFTALRTSGDANVASLDKYTLTYNATDVLTLYPMFRSTLPEITLQFLDRTGNAPAADGFRLTGLRAIDQLQAKDKPDTSSFGNDYRFDKWYYQTVNSDKETVNHDIVFGSENQTGTKVSDICGFDSYFKSGEVKVYSKWILQQGIANAVKYDEIYNILHKENPTDEEKIKIAELLDADIFISGTIDFGTKEYKPLFDANHVFNGTIDGGTYDADKKVTARATIKGSVFSSASVVSVFGNVSGTIKNLIFENNTLTLDKDGDAYASDVCMGVVINRNSGKISNVTVISPTFNLPSGLDKVTIGGIAAINQGASDNIDKGYIDNCVVGSKDAKIVVAANCKSLTFGGIVGENKASSAIVNCKAFVEIQSVDCQSYKIGGVAATNGGQISQCEVAIDVKDAKATDSAYFGGAVADNMSAVDQIAATVNFGSEVNPALMGGTLSQSVNIGGIIGKNEGYVKNSYVASNMYVVLDKSSVIAAIGGVVGNNFSGKSQSGSSTTNVGAINYCYSTGVISVNVAKATKSVKLYVAGIAGRNSQKAISSCFTLVSIDVVNTLADGKNNDENTLYLGFGFGSMEGNAALIKCWYKHDNTLSLNGEKYAVTVVDGEDVENFAITKTGNLKSTDPDNTSSFLTEQWFDDNASFDFKDVWTIESGSLPTLKFLSK